jgi:hypothetical protein
VRRWFFYRVKTFDPTSTRDPCKLLMEATSSFCIVEDARITFIFISRCCNAARCIFGLQEHSAYTILIPVCLQVESFRQVIMSQQGIFQNLFLQASIFLGGGVIVSFWAVMVLIIFCQAVVRTSNQSMKLEYQETIPR